MKTRFNFIQKIKDFSSRRSFRRSIQKSLKQDYHEERDSEELTKTVPPDSEEIEFHCTWVSEVYTPSGIDTLIKCLKRLGWDKPEGPILYPSNLTDWIKQSRSSGRRGMRIDGGMILSHEDNRYHDGLVSRRRGNLPAGVDYARLQLHNRTSSLTVVTIQFVFNDEITEVLNSLLKNTAYKTKVRYYSSGAEYKSAVEQKKQAIKEKREEIHASLYSWFRENLPGHFSSSDPGIFPTVDLITSRLYKHGDEDVSPPPDYIELIFGYDVDIWEREQSLELRISRIDTEKAVITLFGNFDEMTQISYDEFPRRDKRSFTGMFNGRFGSTIMLWAAHNLLLNYERQLSAIRDKAVSRIQGASDALKNLDSIRYHFLSISSDIRIVSDDMAVLSKVKRNYSDNIQDFNPPYYLKKHFNDYPTFIELLRQRDEARTEQLIALEKRVNETIISSGNLASAITNLRIQRNVLCLTIIIAILTLCSLWDWDALLGLVQQILNSLATVSR